MVAVAVLSALLFLSQLGSTGLVDETPPLFAAAARNMVESGDWLTPRVNGNPRFDKPVLVYWLMGLGYRWIPQQLDPFGSLAARLPSALSATVLSLALADLLWCWPQKLVGKGKAWLVPLMASLGFGLCPLVLIWARTAVSDLLFTALVSLSLMGFWRHYASRKRHVPVGSWIALGLAVLTKGPLALALAGFVCLLFGVRQGEISRLWNNLLPLKGAVLVLLVALPWYGAELIVEGQTFWESFFLYHNVMRLTQVVNNHSGPLWFYAPVLLIGAMPQLPMALYGAWTGLAARQSGRQITAAQSLRCFAACWLLAVVIIFTMVATKLPSYMLPAMPAIGLLVGLAAGDMEGNTAKGSVCGAAWLSLALAALVGIGCLLQELWLPWIREPAMPTLAVDVQATGVITTIGMAWLVAAGLGMLTLWRCWQSWLLVLQLVLVAWIPLGLLPLGSLVDHLRQEPVRAMAVAAQEHIHHGEPLAMAGIRKPSLHFYSGHVVRYEGHSRQGLANLAHCITWSPGSETMLVVLDQSTAQKPYWRRLPGKVLAQAGVYELRRLRRQNLEAVVAQLLRAGDVKGDCPVPHWESYNERRIDRRSTKSRSVEGATLGAGAVGEASVTVEMLQLAVPADRRDAWLTAEAQVWQPWLEQQQGYLGRDLYWDPEAEQAYVLIRWRSRQEWKAIAEKEVAAVQARFVAAINQVTAEDLADPIPLKAASQWLLLSREAPKAAERYA